MAPPVRVETPDPAIAAALAKILEGVELLRTSCVDGRRFTLDGRLVGDVGELVAKRAFEIELDATSRKHFDAVTERSREQVQIKATFQKVLGFHKEHGLYIGLKLSADGGFEVIYNGPAHYIKRHFHMRKSIGEKLLSLSVSKLRELNRTIPDAERVPRRGH